MEEHQASPGYVIVGKVIGSWGILGELKIEVHSDAPQRFAPGGRLFINGSPFTIKRSSKKINNNLVLHLQGIDTPEDANAHTGKWLEILHDQIHPLPKSKYYYFQLIGMQVFTMEGNYVGTISEILNTRGNDVYVVKTDNKDVLIPALTDVVKEVDITKKMMRIQLIEGLI